MKIFVRNLAAQFIGLRNETFNVMAGALLAAFVGASAAQSAPMVENFETFEAAPALEVTSTRREQVDRFSYLFVGGYGNELARKHYFKLNVQTTMEIGATHARAHFPSSFNAASKNLSSLREEILEMYERGGRRPVVLIGHSKGGLESLATVLAYPELVRDGIVANVVLVQAPIGGNALIDQRNLIARLYAKFLSISPSFRSLQTKGINEIIANRIAELNPQDLRAVSKAVRYVISHKDAEHSGFAIRLLSNLGGHTLKNDGLVATNDMWLPGFGTILGELYIDHLEVVTGRSVAFIADNMTVDRVRAFTKSMIVNLMLSRNRNNPEFRELTERKTVERLGPMKCEHVFFQAI